MNVIRKVVLSVRFIDIHSWEKKRNKIKPSEMDTVECNANQSIAHLNFKLNNFSINVLAIKYARVKFDFVIRHIFNKFGSRRSISY